MLDCAGGGDCLIKAAAFAHYRLRGLRVIPQRRILDARIQLVKAAQRAVPVKKAAHQRERFVNAVDMGLRFGAH